MNQVPTKHTENTYFIYIKCCQFKIDWQKIKLPNNKIM